jgi:hypothetical protein
MKVIADLAVLPLVVQAAFFADSGTLNRQFFVIASIVKSISLFGQFYASRICGVVPLPAREFDSKATGGLLLSLWTLPFAILLYYYPRALGPGESLQLYQQRGNDDVAFDDLTLFAMRLEGAHLMMVLPLLLNFGRMSDFIVQGNLIACILYMVVFNRGAFDSTGRADMDAFRGQQITHLTLTVLAWALGGTHHHNHHHYRHEKSRKKLDTDEPEPTKKVKVM